MKTVLFISILAVIGCGQDSSSPSVPVPSPVIGQNEPAPPIPIKIELAACPNTAIGVMVGLDVREPRLYHENLLVVWKSKRRMAFYRSGYLRQDQLNGGQACWRVALGVNREGEYVPGAKIIRGDRRTPEGWYRISDNPASRYAGAISIHYPNDDDARLGRLFGLIDDGTERRIANLIRHDAKPPQDTILGGLILFHGGGAAYDWTEGCVALDDENLESLRGLLPRPMNGWTLILP